MSDKEEAVVAAEEIRVLVLKHATSFEYTVFMQKDGYIAGTDRKQSVLFPDTIDDYITPDNPVRFIDAFVEALDLILAGFKHAELSDTGRPPYNPGDLLKLYIYGYLNHIRSSRKLEKECMRNVEVMWIMRRLTPDFKTIADFRKDNVECIRKVFRTFVKLCDELDLFGRELVSVDGTTFRAVNSKDRHFNTETLNERLKHIEERIERYLKEIDENDSGEEDSSGNSEGDKDRDGRVKELNEKIGKLKEKKSEYEGMLRSMEEKGETELSLTDTDSRMMRNNGRLEVCYNVQTAVDSKNKLIADYDVNNSQTDQNLLTPMVKGAMEMLGVEKIEATADKGYNNFDEMKRCVDSGITPYVPEANSSARGSVRMKNGVPSPEFYQSKFRYDSACDSYICPAGQRLEFWYRNNNLHDKRFDLYRTDACPACPFYKTKCTMSRNGRVIERWEHQYIVDEARARLETPDGKKKFALRKELSEHPFGTMKRAFNQGYLLLKGLKKVRGEVGFTMLAYDMRRAINTVGTAKLIGFLQGLRISIVSGHIRQ
ncbi:MAG: IS1182 family transposase [Candidatus Thermoplasmatota archaeon]|nr:IS1182 family transposase [Candidatus Thermoplasmatota archaeon]